jgi:hypothetical protein
VRSYYVMVQKQRVSLEFSLDGTKLYRFGYNFHLSSSLLFRSRKPFSHNVSNFR